jgi:anti-sigma factor RsiW
MNCKNAQSLLSAYLDEELGGREMLDIREHLYGCDACAKELESIEAVKRLVCGTPIPEPSADFEERLVTHVLSATATPHNSKRASIITLGGIAAASMLGTMLLLNSMHQETKVVEQRDTMPYELVKNGRSFDAGADPMNASPVSFNLR